MGAASSRALTPVGVVVVICLLAACTANRGPERAVRWQEIPPSALTSAASIPLVETAVWAGGRWRMGGVVIGPDGSRHVAIWTSSAVGGPWAPDDMVAVTGRDGPNETIFGISGDATHMVAFGYRRSPTEGYPRPSTWLSRPATGPSWHEILEDREFFGGPDIIGFGNLTYGTHGFTIAGTWTDPQGRPTLAVWRSPEGEHWTRDSTEPAFQGDAADIPLASGVADGPSGLLMSGSVSTPTPAAPTRREGGLWWSSSGQTWEGLPITPAGRPAPLSTTFDAVTAVAGGWAVAGTETTATGSRAAVWFVDSRLRMSGPQLLSRDAKPLSLTSDGTTVMLVAADGDRPEIWTAEAGPAVPRRWTTLRAPVAHTGFDITGGTLQSSRSGWVLVLAGADHSSEWWSR